MTDPDQPFRRPQRERQSGITTKMSEQSATPATGAEEPLILDPELHQSVLKPRQEFADPSGNGRSDSSPTTRRTKKMRMGTAAIVAALGLSLALVAAVLVPKLLHTPTWPSRPLVVDISTPPEISWSSSGGQPCSNPPDADTAILSETGRVWSLDLSNGQTNWSVDVDVGSNTGVTCLPGADLVAVTMTEVGDETAVGTKLLSASSGVEVAELPRDSARLVIPLGSDIGLVDDTNMLSAVQPEELDSPLWSRQLLGPPGQVTSIGVEEVDDDVVHIVYYTASGTEERDDAFTITVTKADGTSPPWSRGSSAGYAEYQRLGDVVTERLGDVFAQHTGDSASVFDLQGEKLWDLGNDQLGAAGSRLYVSWPSSPDPDTGYTNLHQVDPRTGTKIRGDSFKGWFDYTVPVKDHIAVLRGGRLLILDGHLQEQPAISVEAFSTIYEGQKWVYTESDPDRSGDAVLSAIDPDGARVLWTRILDYGQHVRQLGRHLIVVDEEGTFHGLTTGS